MDVWVQQYLQPEMQWTTKKLVSSIFAVTLVNLSSNIAISLNINFLEAWFYCLVSGCKDGELGWEYKRGYDVILAAKKEEWKTKNRERFLTGLPKQFLIIMQLIDKIQPGRTFHYQQYYSLLNEIIEVR